MSKKNGLRKWKESQKTRQEGPKTVVWPKPRPEPPPPVEWPSDSASLYLQALLGWDFKASDVFPGCECIECQSDDVEIADYAWSCNACGSKGTIEIVVKTTTKGKDVPAGGSWRLQ